MGLASGTGTGGSSQPCPTRGSVHLPGRRQRARPAAIALPTGQEHGGFVHQAKRFGQPGRRPGQQRPLCSVLACLVSRAFPCCPPTTTAHAAEASSRRQTDTLRVTEPAISSVIQPLLPSTAAAPRQAPCHGRKQSPDTPGPACGWKVKKNVHVNLVYPRLSALASVDNQQAPPSIQLSASSDPPSLR